MLYSYWSIYNKMNINLKHRTMQCSKTFLRGPFYFLLEIVYLFWDEYENFLCIKYYLKKNVFNILTKL